MLQKLALIYAGSVVWGRVAGALEAAGIPFGARIALFGFVFVAVLVASMVIWQESLLYMPAVPNPQNPFAGNMKKPSDSPEGLRSPDEQGMQYEDVTLVASDGVRSHAWFIPARAARDEAPTLIFSHENAGSMALRLPEFRLLHERLGYNLLVYDYRGYGQSDDARIDEDGLMRDAHAAWRWLLEQGGVDTTRVVLYGRSLGGAVSIQLARDLCEAGGPAPLPAGLIVCNTFTSIEAMLAAKYAWLDWGIVRRRLLRMRWRSVEHIAKVRLPILIIVGLRDEIVPSQHAKLLADAATAAPSVEMREVAAGTHNDTWMKAGESYLTWLRAFVEASAMKARDKKLQ